MKYLNERRTTCHWAAPIRVNALQPRHYGNERLKIDYGSFEKENLDEYMDEIIVLNEGKVIAKGDHATLLKTCDYYYDTWQLQQNETEAAAC